jgi:tetratricopeptide (TPR) repeat protein
LHKAFSSEFLKRWSPDLPKVLGAGVILICATKTAFLNGDWKSDFDAAYAWIRDYPADGEGYGVLGKIYFRAGDFAKAGQLLAKGIILGDPFPNDALALAESYMEQGKDGAAESLLKQIIVRYPDYARARPALGYLYFQRKEYRRCEKTIEAALILDPAQARGYGLLMKVLLCTHKLDEAKAVLNKAKAYVSPQNWLDLRQIL